MKFTHHDYRRMAEQGSMTLNSFDLSDMNVVFPNDDTAVLTYRVKQSLTPRGECCAQFIAASSLLIRYLVRYLVVASPQKLHEANTMTEWISQQRKFSPFIHGNRVFELCANRSRFNQSRF